ncbi:MAG: extracellular solute-binding protein [Opitutaceae bacterium]|jgi:raffinose/stachyose/melibiose transport system permease protein
MRNPAAFILALAIAGAAHGQGDVQLDVPIRAAGYGMAFYEESARLFEAARPGTKVRVYGDPRIDDRISVRVIDGNYPDAASAPYVLWPSLIRAGKVLDLRPYLQGPNWEGDARWGDTFYPGSLDTWRVDGRIGGLPLSYSAWTIFFNRGLFRAHGWREPRTWDEFYALCERIRAAGIAPLSVPGVNWLYADAFFRAACYNLEGAAGWERINSLAPGARVDPRFIRAAAVEQRVMQRYALRGWEGESHTGAELDFLQGRAAMTVSGSWFVNEMAGKIPADFELGTMNFPVFADGIADPTAIQTGSDCFFVFATGDPERENRTIDFLRFLTSRARAEAFVRELNSPVAVRGVPLSAYSGQMQDTARMILRAKEAYLMPQQMMQPPELRQVLIDCYQRLTTGRMTPQEYGERLESAAAVDRARAVDPNRVEYRHPLAGWLLLAALAGTFGWVFSRGRSGFLRRLFRRGGAQPFSRADSDPGRQVRLRSSVGLGFAGPAFLLYAALVLAPAITAFGWAFTRWNGVGPRAWVGLFNFKWLLFENDGFWFALGNNAFLMLVPALFVVPLALVCAALLHRGVWGGGVFRVIFLFPNMLGGIAATLLWLAAYEPHGGLVNASFSALGRLVHSPALANFDGFPWLSPEHLYASLIPIYLWMACGFNLILYLAAMEGIDPQLYEAAEMDGASALRQFFTITLPLIREVIVISAVFLVIGGLNAFEMIWLLTAQDPSAASQTLGTLLVTSMFKEFEIGRAAALAAVLFILVLAGSAAVLRGLGREAEER